MTKYIEEYVINRMVYGISEDFQPWVGGCRIGSADSKEEARKILHQYAISDCRAKARSYQGEVDQAQSALAGLSEDVFNLGKFRKVHQ